MPGASAENMAKKIPKGGYTVLLREQRNGF
jgi:hypothetical protein